MSNKAKQSLFGPTPTNAPTQKLPSENVTLSPSNSWPFRPADPAKRGSLLPPNSRARKS